MNELDQQLEKKRKTALIFFERSNRKNSPYYTEVKKYYKNTKWLLFRLFGSKDGFMHIGLSRNKFYKKNKGYELFQPSFVNKFIQSNGCKFVLELGCGQGTNLAYLASKNLDAKFWGIDLCPSNYLVKGKKNVHILTGDYHDLSKISSNSIDLIYAIETLCYAENIKKVLQEAYRVLSDNGILIVFDAYRQKETERYTFEELVYLKTIEDGFRLKQFQDINFFNQITQQSGFMCLKEIDLKQYALGYLNDITTRINKYLRLGIFLKIFLQLFPDDVLGGMKAGYLIEDSIKYNITTYKLHIFKKIR